MPTPSGRLFVGQLTNCSHVRKVQRAMSRAGRTLIPILAIVLATLVPMVGRAGVSVPLDDPRVEEPRDVVKPTVLPDETPAQTQAGQENAQPKKPEDGAAAPRALDQNSNPCKGRTPTVHEAWIDRVQNGVFRGVCGGAVWFDSFFGEKHVYDTSDLYGRIGLGMLYKTSGEYDGRSRFDANIPLPNMNVKAAAFVGRDNPNDYISQTNDALAVPATFLRLSDDQSWLAGLGYTPSRRRLNRLNFRLGSQVSAHPYVFGQVRYQNDRYLDATSALRLQETLFYRSSADGLGLTTRVGYDWLPGENFFARLSSSASLTRKTKGVRWNAFATLYQDMSERLGRARGASYQLLVSGETSKDVPVQEYGFLGVYREQVFRPWMFADLTLGYTFPRREITDERKGAVNIGIVMEILFGNVPNAYGGTRTAAKPKE